jgi:hypothetical protein
MPKRFQIGPLPERHDRYLTLWAWGKRRSRAALATHTLEARIETNIEEIESIIQDAANHRGISYEDMKARILENPHYDWGDDEPESL